MPAMQVQQPVDMGQVDKAIAALLKYAGQRQDASNDLFEDDEFIYLVSGARASPYAA